MLVALAPPPTAFGCKPTCHRHVDTLSEGGLLTASLAEGGGTLKA